LVPPGQRPITGQSAVPTRDPQAMELAASRSRCASAVWARVHDPTVRETAPVGYRPASTEPPKRLRANSRTVGATAL
jgi:hypothetical protein